MRLATILFLISGTWLATLRNCVAEDSRDAQSQKPAVERSEAPVSFRPGNGRLGISIGKQSIGEYVFQDETTLRPYFRNLRTLSGVPVTRNHPPVKGQDIDDHPTMHPGLWLAFGDINGADFWRNKGQVRHVRFVKEPRIGPMGGSFTVENSYEIDGKAICAETCEITIKVRPDHYLFDWRSNFQSKQDFTFGDQEEMGLGVRVATPLAVVKGGEIGDSQNRKNGAQVWGQQADWCQYGGVMDRQRVGIALMPSPKNFRRSWFHARDYGLLVANPFGRNAFTKGDKSQVTIKPGDQLELRFGVVAYGTVEDKPVDIAGIYQKYISE